MRLSKSRVLKSSLVLILTAAAAGQISSVPYIAINQAEVDGRIWALNGNGVADDTAKLQAAITYAVANQRTLLLRRPSVAYRITSKLNVGPGTAVYYGFDMEGVGQPRILWDGAAGSPMLDVCAIAESRIENLWLDGGGVAGVTGLRHRSNAGLPSQRNTYRRLMVQNCTGYGVRLIQDANATVDYVEMDMCCLTTNGIGLRVEGDMRQIDVRGGSIAYSTTYGISIASGHVNIYDGFFAANGSGSLYLGSNLASLHVYRSVHEDHPVLTGGGTWNAYSPLLSPIVLCGVKQDMYILPFPAGPAIDYNAYKALVLVGCSFVQSVNIGADALNVQSVNTEFVPFAYSGVNAWWTGHTEKVGQNGNGIFGLPDVFVGPFTAQIGDVGFDKSVTLEWDGSWDNESWPLPIQLPVAGAMTLYDVYAYVIGTAGSTLDFNLEERAAGTINTAGSDIFAADQTATTAGAHFTVFADSALAAGSHLWWKTPATGAAVGTVDAIKLVIKAR